MHFVTMRSLGKGLMSLVLLTCVTLYGVPSHSKTAAVHESQTALFNNLPRVALLVKEQYVEPSRIKPDAMLASILESLESRISKLVVSLPKSLETALELARATEDKPVKDNEISEEKSVNDLTVTENKQALDMKAGEAKPEAVSNEALKQKLVLDLGGVKKSIDYEPQRSIWGMIFLLRDIFKFVEVEAKKQGLMEKSKVGEEPIDWEKIENGAINALLGTLDPHSVFLEPKYARDLTLTTKGEFGGIGIVISVRDGFLTVISAIDGTPAALAGVKAKDRIIKIDDDSAINMDLNDAVNILRGKPDSTVKITVQRANSSKELEFALKRAIIKVDSVAYALLENNVGYLRVKAFQGNTAGDVKDAILAMKRKSKDKMSGLILDLRGNPGGLLREAVEVSNLFLDGGEVVSTQGAQANSRQVEMATAGELDPHLKLVTLVDGGSASASEIVAGALKNGGLKNGRGIVVGERTFGKGSVQMLFDFPSIVEPATKTAKPQPVQPAALKLTIAEYFGPNNTSIQNIGVGPDIGLAAVHVDKPEEVSLFPETGMREVDLEGHLAPDKRPEKRLEEKTTVSLEYLAPAASDEALEYGKLDLPTLKKDFAVTVALEFINASKGASRAALLENAQAISTRLQKQEHKKIIEALKKYKIDWSEGVSRAKDGIKAAVTENKGATSGSKLKVAVKVKNTSKEPLYQVHGITHSKTPLFNQKEFLFGKLAPGQEIERFVEFEIPKDVVTRKDLMSLELRDYRREKIGELDIPLDIKGLGRPRFSHLVFVDDSKSGNGDGRVQNGEDVELTVWLKNIGDGKAFEPTVLLRNESGSKVFLKNGRAQSGELLPTAETSMKFAFRVKEPCDKVDFEIQIFDGQMHDIWRDKIAIDVAPKAKSKSIARTLVLKNHSANIWSKPNDKAQKIATVREGLRFEAIKEVNDFLLAKIDTNLVGFIKKSDVKDAPKISKEAVKKKSDFYSINYDRIPAQISLKFGDASGWSKTDSGRVYADIIGTDRLADLLMYVNGKKVLYKEINKVKNNEKIEYPINLKPGINVITVFAREDATFGQRENITVFYDQEGRASRSLEKTPASAAKTN